MHRAREACAAIDELDAVIATVHIGDVQNLWPVIQVKPTKRVDVSRLAVRTQ
jgi:hypothetical protein